MVTARVRLGGNDEAEACQLGGHVPAALERPVEHHFSKVPRSAVGVTAHKNIGQVFRTVAAGGLHYSSHARRLPDSPGGYSHWRRRLRGHERGSAQVHFRPSAAMEIVMALLVRATTLTR